MLLAIGELKRRAEHAAGREFRRAVLGRPVFFVDDNPEADRRAENTLRDIAHAVGFHEIAFQFEPIAAAFDYESQISKEELVLVADIGGGTSDFSLVRLSPGRAHNTDRREDILANGDRDRKKPHGPSLPHHRTYGSRIRWLLETTLISCCPDHCQLGQPHCLRA